MIEELTLDQVLFPQEPSPREKENHSGFISVNAHIFGLLDLSLVDCNTQGQLEDNGVFVKIHKLLRLPQNYTIRAIFNRYTLDGSWDIWVISPDLPAVPSCMELPTLKLTYQRLGDGTIRLHKIKIKDEWEKVYSDPNVCPTCGREIDDAR